MTTRRPCGPRTYVGLDLETTGVDHRTDRIIEIGATRFTDGEPVDAFCTFVDPSCEIPSDVVYLTGITDEQIAGAPSIDEALPDLRDFLRDDPVVAHSAAFDVGFLDAASGVSLFEGRDVYDTLALSRALLPRLPSHRLVALARFFDIDAGRSHRAADDARAVGRLFGSLVLVLDGVGGRPLKRLHALSPPPFRRLFEEAIERNASTVDPAAVPDFGERNAELLRYDNVWGDRVERRLSEDVVEPDVERLERLFEAGGELEGRLSGYEERREQMAMLRAVNDALTGGVHLLVEAGTGVGKSLAYLIPAIHFAAENGERVIVSTNTKNLQEQLFFKDVPFLGETLEVDFKATLLKGRGNYICAKRWDQLLDQGLPAGEREHYMPLVIWEEETTSGDIAENAAFRPWGYLWSRVSADGGPCLGSRCPASDRCYLQRARRAAQASHLVVVNHSLLFSDTGAGNRILGEYSYLVCDEAHNMESVATEHLGRRVNVYRFRAALESLFRKDGRASGDLVELENRLEGLDGQSTEMALTAAGRLRENVEKTATLGDAFFAALALRHIEMAGGRTVEYGKLRYAGELSVSSILGDELGGVLSSLEGLVGDLETLGDLVVDVDFKGVDAASQTLAYHAERLRELREDLEYLALGRDERSVFWLEVRTRRSGVECTLRSAPVSVAELMPDFLYSKVSSMIATSATMTVDGGFRFIMERLGLDALPDWKVVTLDVGSPYDYGRQVIAAVAGYLPQPSSRGFNSVVGELLVKLAAPADGGTLALFTSRSSLDAVFRAVRDPLAARGKLVLAQGHGGSTALLDEFSRVTDSVLLATSSFWEGVDVPGRSLEQLVIVKLPFPVPKDPVIEAHCEAYEKEGLDAFTSYMVPRTAIRMRQGFGRLIRSSIDTGVVVLLDSRLATRGYGRRLLDELPAPAAVAESETALLKMLGVLSAV
ncbi:MAG: DEAD/DEAH box helicase [Candidatus Eisenbacteria bacterium]|nr:DEAD/DEAH box helicase [Candidatus Eisenbacteria bacterium]